MKPVELNDILTYRFLSGLRFSPGGKRAAFVVSAADEEGKGYEATLWLYENGAVRQLTALGQERSFAWLDDERLLFPAVRTAKEKKRAEAKEDFTSLYVLDLRGGEALPLLELPFAAESIRVLDGGHLAVTASVDKRRSALYAAGKEEREAAQKEREENRDYEVFDELPWWFNGAGVRSGQRRSLYLVELATGKITPLTVPPEEVSDLTVLGDELIFALSAWETVSPLRGFTLRAFNWKSGETRTLCRNDELLLEQLIAAGERLLLFATEGKRFGLNENAWVYELDPASGDLRVLRREEYNLYNSVGSDCRLGGGRDAVPAGDRLFHLATREGDCLLYRLDPDGSDTPVVTKPGSIDCFDLSGDEALLIALYDMKLQELYRCDLKSGALEQVSHFNDEALRGRYVAQPKPLTVESAGLSIGGWVLEPRDCDPAKRYPAVLDVHGGPKTVYGPVFYHEMQVWASKGYFVFFCNPKGSDGRDNAFADIRGAYGCTDYQNLMDFTDAVLAAYPQIDPARVCETGGSYGGFMTNWIVGHTDRFCCAASQRSISNWLSFQGVSDIGAFFTPDQNDADPWESPEKLWARSPLKYADKVVTPTLFIHSDEDYRCPLDQGLQMLSALLQRGVPARLCLFRGENHELSRSGKPKHRLRRLREITDWFDAYSKEKTI